MKQEINNRKVAIIGCGFVGAASGFALMQSGLFSEMVLSCSGENYNNKTAYDAREIIQASH